MNSKGYSTIAEYSSFDVRASSAREKRTISVLVGTRGVATSTVASPPHIQLHSGREQVFVPGEVVKLQCEASGSPPPT